MTTPTTNKLALAVNRVYNEICECQATIAYLERIRDTYETDGVYDYALASLADHLRELKHQRTWHEGRYCNGDTDAAAIESLEIVD